MEHFENDVFSDFVSLGLSFEYIQAHASNSLPEYPYNYSHGKTGRIDFYLIRNEMFAKRKAFVVKLKEK